MVLHCAEARWRSARTAYSARSHRARRYGIASDNKTDEAISEGYIEKDFPEYLDEFKRLRDYFEQNILAINGATGDFVMSIRDLRLRWRVVFYTEEPDVEDRKQKYIGFWGSHEDAVREWRELAETL